MHHRARHRLASSTVALALGLGLPLTAAAADELECLPRVPTQIWSDSGSGGSHDVSIWRPTAGYSLGDLAVRGYGHTGELCGFVDQSDDPARPALQPASAFIWRYNDRKTGAHRNVSVWEPVCDPGYVAMGDVAAPSHLNDTLKCPVDQACREHRLLLEFDRFRCVRDDLVRPRGGTATFVWNDRKTGGAHDVSFWSRPGGADQPGLTNLAFFWAHRSHAQPSPAALTVAKHELKPGTVATPRPVDDFDEQTYYNLRLKGTNLYVAVDNPGLGEFYTLIPDAADPRAQFRFRPLKGHHEIVNRTSGGKMRGASSIGGPTVDDTIHTLRPMLVRDVSSPPRSHTWTLKRRGDRAFQVVTMAASRVVVWAVKPRAGARLVNLVDKTAPLEESLFELLPVKQVTTAELPSGVFDPDIGDDRALRIGIAAASALVSAASGGRGGGLISLAGLFLGQSANDALAEALQRLYNQVQIDIANEIAAKSLTEAGNALLDATFLLTVEYPETLRDNIDDPSRRLSLQNSAKDAARAFLAVRQRLTLERQGGRVAAKPANALLIEGGLQVYATAAALHAAALQEAALIAAFDTVGSFSDELQTLDAEIERWIGEYQEMFDAQLDWRKDSVVVNTTFTKPRLHAFLFKPGSLAVTLLDKATLVSPQRAIGRRTEEVRDLRFSIQPPTAFENALRARYRAELEFAYGRRYQPAELASSLRALKVTTAELCAKIRDADSQERQEFLASARAGRSLAPRARAEGVGIKAQGASSSAPRPARSKLKMVKRGRAITWEIERTPG